MKTTRSKRNPLFLTASPELSSKGGEPRVQSCRRSHRVLARLADYNQQSSAQAAHVASKPRTLVAAQGLNTNHILLLVILGLCCITSVTSAYYLYSPRWAIHSWKTTSAQAGSIGSMEPLVLDQHNSPPHITRDGTKYLSYLPHSGVHNQRIALENALTLALLLNRTLLLPPLRLAHRAVRYLAFDSLDHSLKLSGSEGLEHCGDVPPYVSLPVECLDYFDSTTLDWHSLFDMSTIQKNQPVLQLATLSPSAYSAWLSSFPDGVAQLRDETRYHYHFLDVDVPHPRDKYGELVHISELARAPETLLQLGTLFGTNRLLLSDDGVSLLSTIRRSMVLRNEALEQIAGAVVKRISKPFIGVHLRVGDGQFSERREETLHETWCLLLRRIGYTCLYNSAVSRSPELRPGLNHTTACHEILSAVSQIRHDDRPSRISGLRPPCGKISQSVFISTDLEHPEEVLSLLPFRELFSSVYLISHFADELRLLRALRNHDGVELYRYLLPFLEAMVVARGEVVVGTRRSTFSKFIEHTLWPAYHHQREPDFRNAT